MLLRLALLWLPLPHDVVMWWSFGQASCTHAWQDLAWWDSHPPKFHTHCLQVSATRAATLCGLIAVW